MTTGRVLDWVPPSIPLPGAPVAGHVELALSAAAAGRSGLRATIDYRSDGDDFAGRVAAGERAAREAVACLPGAVSDEAGAALSRLLAAVYPDPGRIDPRTRFGAWLGLIADAGESAGLAGVKLYCNLAAPGGAGVAALTEAWPAFAPPVTALLGDGLGEARMAAVKVDAGGGRSVRVYARARPSRGHQFVSRVARRCGLDANRVLADVTSCGFRDALWNDDVVVKVEADESGEPGDVAVHLAASGGAPRDWSAARRLLDTAGGDGSAASLLAGSGIDPAGWTVAGVGLGYRLGAAAPTAVDRVNVYVRPAAGGP